MLGIIILLLIIIITMQYWLPIAIAQLNAMEASLTGHVAYSVWL